MYNNDLKRSGEALFKLPKKDLKGIFNGVGIATFLGKRINLDRQLLA